MTFINTSIPDVWIIEPSVFSDERGYFMESYNSKWFLEHGIAVNFVQDNESKSKKDVVRGLHFQKPPYSQGKLIRVIKGAVLDVAVDLRKSSPHYGQHIIVELSEENKRMFWMPEGFAHGFRTLRDDTVLSYKCTSHYHKEAEGSILWNDETLNIPWGIEHPILSAKDTLSPHFIDFRSPFI